MKKTCFLFGAGVERAYGISGGSDFAINVLGIKNKVMNEAIKEFYNDVISKSDNKEWYTTCENRTLKKKELLEAALRKKILDEILADSHINNASEIQNKKIYEDKVEERLKELIKDNEKDDEINEEQLAVIENYTSYIGIIDSKFHTIIYPKALGPQNFWKVISCYTRAYLLIVTQMIPKFINKQLTKEDYLYILKNPKHIHTEILEFCKIKKDEDEKLKEDAKVSEELKKQRRYYSILANHQEKDIKIITSNYTPLCEELAGVSKENIAYVHGKIGWFESPCEMKVYDIFEEKLPNELYFPYIFI